MKMSFYFLWPSELQRIIKYRSRRLQMSEYTLFASPFSCYLNKNDKERSNRRKPTPYECLFPISIVKSIFNVHVQTGSSTFLYYARAVAGELSILYLTLTRNGLKGNSPRKIHKKDRLSSWVWSTSVAGIWWKGEVTTSYDKILIYSY